MSITNKRIFLLVFILFLGASAIGSYHYFTTPYYPTVHEYILETKTAQFVEANAYKIDGHQARCENRPTVLYNKFDSWGGAYPGFIIMNPKAIKKLPTIVKLYIYYHECGHQFSGINEAKSDNFAILQGVKAGWLKNNQGMNKICRFVSKIPADKMHPKGIIRCQNMEAYFKKIITKHTIK